MPHSHDHARPDVPGAVNSGPMTLQASHPIGLDVSHDTSPTTWRFIRSASGPAVTAPRRVRRTVLRSRPTDGRPGNRRSGAGHASYARTACHTSSRSDRGEERPQELSCPDDSTFVSESQRTSGGDWLSLAFLLISVFAFIALIFWIVLIVWYSDPNSQRQVWNSLGRLP